MKSYKDDAETKMGKMLLMIKQMFSARMNGKRKYLTNTSSWQQIMQKRKNNISSRCNAAFFINVKR